MEAAGVQVGLALAPGGRHVLRLDDPATGRSLSHALARGPDAEATLLCCSLALAADVPGTTGHAVALAARWPELAALARVRAAG
jgi:hypothetical protein